MNKRTHRRGVLVIAPAKGRGGIASVIRLHSQTNAWKSMGCSLLSTYDDRSVFRKLLAAAKSYVAAPLLVSNANIVHIHLAAQKSVFRKLPFILLAKLFRKPLIIHVHAFSVESLFDETAFRAGQFALRFADRVVALSQSWADVMSARDSSLKITVIPNPVDTRPLLLNQSKLDTLAILFAGKLEIRKGYQDLLVAAVSVLKRFPSAQFWFAGHGDLEIASAMAEQFGIDKSVKFMGWLGTHEMAAAYETASIFCLPSYHEGVPMAVLEAMGHGLPVVCTRVGGLPDYIEQMRNGLFANAGDPASIADGIVYLLSNPTNAGLIGRRAAESIHASCGLSVISQYLEDLYAEIYGEYADGVLAAHGTSLS